MGLRRLDLHIKIVQSSWDNTGADLRATYWKKVLLSHLSSHTLYYSSTTLQVSEVFNITAIHT